MKEAVKQYWDSEPCGTRGIPYPVGSVAYYDAIENKRDRLDPLASEYAQYGRWAGKRVLEVGCGVGIDLVRFAQAGAFVVGIDLSPRSVLLARERLRLYKCRGVVLEGDAEKLVSEDSVFDFVFGWGCLHHMSNPTIAVWEIHRVLKHGGEVCAMLYHKPSVVALQMYLVFGLLWLRPWRSVNDILASYHESPGTRAYTVGETRQMFSMFQNVKVDIRVTSYDLRYWRDMYLPLWVRKIVPHQLGWNIIVRGRKA